MQFNQNYYPMTETPKEGAYACLGLSEQLAQEVANAFEAGTGPGTPDANGFMTVGTPAPGSVVMLDTDGTWIAGVSPEVTGGSAALPKALFFVHQGVTEQMGASVGRLVALRGMASFLTNKVNGTSFTVGAPLIAVGGNFQIKVLGDAKQIVGWVGPLGYADGRLDVMYEACCWG